MSQTQIARPFQTVAYLPSSLILCLVPLDFMDTKAVFYLVASCLRQGSRRSEDIE